MKILTHILILMYSAHFLLSNIKFLNFVRIFSMQDVHFIIIIAMKRLRRIDWDIFPCLHHSTDIDYSSIQCKSLQFIDFSSPFLSSHSPPIPIDMMNDSTTLAHYSKLKVNKNTKAFDFNFAMHDQKKKKTKKWQSWGEEKKRKKKICKY